MLFRSYGHYGFHAGEYATRARHTLRNDCILPGNVPGATAPRPGGYYIHHPILTHQLVTASFALFGDHEASVRLASIFAFMTCFALLTLLLSRQGGTGPALAGASTFAVVPIHAWYAAHIDPGFPAIAALLGAFTCYLAWLESGAWRSGAGALALLALSEGFEWTPYLVTVPWAIHVVVTARRERGRYVTFVPWFVAAALIPAVLHIIAVRSAGQWADFIWAYGSRSASLSHTSFLTTMSAYCRTLIGRPLLAAIGVSLIAHLLRLVRRRSRPRDLVFLCMLAATLGYFELFRVAVVTHAYRLLFGGTIAALAVADLWETTAALLAHLGRRRASMAAAVLVAAILAGTLPTTWGGLIESRAHGGIPEWRVFDPRLPRSMFARTLTRRSRLGDRILLHPSFPFRMEIGYELDRDFTSGVRLSTLAPSVALPGVPAQPSAGALVAFAVDALDGEERRALGRLLARHPFVQMGTFGLLDLRVNHPGVDVFKLVGPSDDHRSLLRRYLFGPYEYPALVRDDAKAAAYIAEIASTGPAVERPGPPASVSKR